MQMEKGLKKNDMLKNIISCSVFFIAVAIFTACDGSDNTMTASALSETSCSSVYKPSYSSSSYAYMPLYSSSAYMQPPIHIHIECENHNLNVVYDSLVDRRDGQVYRTVTIGTQTWMAQNLNYYDESMLDQSLCFGDDKEYCEKYGRIYRYSAAKSACPIGWHLPNYNEWSILINAVGGKSIAGRMLKSASDWADREGKCGNDDFGFSALPASIRFCVLDISCNDFYGAAFWGTSEHDSNYVYRMDLNFHDDDAEVNRCYDLECYNNMNSVRCIQDDSSAVSSSSVNSKNDAIENTFKDSRDGQVYKTVVIGSQTWMAQNLNYETDNSYCYDNQDSNCTKYGRLYTWAAAMDSAGVFSLNGAGCGYDSEKSAECAYHFETCSPIYPLRGVCPEGWHLPTEMEWNALFSAVGGVSIAAETHKTTYNWDRGVLGTDAVSFSVLPAGYRRNDGYFGKEGSETTFWSASESSRYGCSCAYAVFFSKREMYVELFDTILKDEGSSVRCVQDSESQNP